MCSSMPADRQGLHAVALVCVLSSTLLSACARAAVSIAPSARPPSVATSAPAAWPVCRFGAFAQESDPAGLNVREAPSLASRVLGRLPPLIKSQDLPDYKVRVEVNVVQGTDGWVRVRDARDNTALTGRPARPMFTGVGWVAARKLTVKSQSQQGRVSPDPASSVSVELREGGSFDGDAWMAATQLISCQGDWALVEVNEQAMTADQRSGYAVTAVARKGLPAGRFRVWLNRICGNQETSCDGLGSETDSPRR